MRWAVASSWGGEVAGLSLPRSLPARDKSKDTFVPLHFRPWGQTGVSVCLKGRGGERCKGLGQEGGKTRDRQPRGEGLWEREGVGQGRRAGKGSLGRPEHRRGRPHTRHCLDAAIIVSSEHPGSAGSAERELNKELREEESREKSARGAGSWPVGLFLCLETPLCAPQRCPIRPGSHVGVGRESRVSCGGGGGRGGEDGIQVALVFLDLEGSGSEDRAESRPESRKPSLPLRPSCCVALARNQFPRDLVFSSAK